MVVRKAEAADASALAELAERTFRDAFAAQNTPGDMDLHCGRHFGEALQLEEIRDPALVTLLCDEEGQPAGYLQLRWGSASPALAARQPAEIQRLYVDQRWHGRGVAQRLMAEAMRLAALGGADRVWLGVWEHNPRAIAFYAKCGFEEVGEQRFLLGGDPQRDVVMAKKLGARRPE